MSMDMFDGMFDSPEGAVPQNPLADLVEGHGLQGALHSALPSGLGDGCLLYTSPSPRDD